MERLGLLLFPFFVVGCDKKETEIQEIPNNHLENVYYEVIHSKRISGVEFLKDFIGSYLPTRSSESSIVLDYMRYVDKLHTLDSVFSFFERLNLSSKAGFQIVTYNYKSIDQYGKDIKLSSLLAVPMKDISVPVYKSPQYIALDCHWTSVKGVDCATESELPTVFLATRGPLVVSPDYQGFGETLDSVQLYLCEEVSAQQSLDAVRAAVKLIKDDFNIELSKEYYTRLIGYSSGAAVAMATAKAIETMSEEEKEILD